MINRIINIGINNSQSPIDQRRVRLVNSFSLFSFIIIIFFSVSNIFVGSYFQALIISSGIVLLCIPSILLNYFGKHKTARIYFSTVSLLIVSGSSFNSILSGQLRFNEFFLTGYAAFIVIMLENPARRIYFISTILIALLMISARRWSAGLEIDSDTLMAYVNILTGFGCIYFFTIIFKRDLLKSNFELKDASEELRAKQETLEKQRDEILNNRQILRSAIDSVPLFISLLDMNGVYLIANSRYEETFGIPVKEIEGNHYSKVLTPDILKMHTPLITKGLKGESPSFEGPTEMPDGEIRELLGRYTPIFDLNGKQIGLSVYVVDITKLKNTEAELINLNNTKNRLLSLIGHDVKTPLNSLKGMINVADKLEDSELKSVIRQISDKLYTVNFSLDNLLNWAKAQMDGFKFEIQEVEINEQLNKNINLFKDEIRSKNLKVKITGSNKLFVKADKESVNLVVRNILSNAIKFSPKNEAIDIILEEEKSFTSIKIIDHGQGISESISAELKEGRQTVKSGVGTQGEKGTGLGLSLSLEIVKGNHGSLDISQGKVNGTEVTIKFPAAKSVEKEKLKS